MKRKDGEKKMRRDKLFIARRGQGVVEYILLVAIVIALLLAFFRPNGPFSEAFQRTLDQQGSDMVNAAKIIF
ncbi:MAG TPA: hypothetical protein PKV41_07010 [Candidatus Omnitrophota bacterium]|nr:hypothetical protein [Candidatus Omnitrophota bacterium]